ncbi:alginate O-acetyltransferase AlgX-related protein [Achromobacter aloeverae]|uniref:Cell division protein FtsQ n=1 Tax=Achromobacter aloeverae TaxID=1750518 RepID=A0A4Q1HGU4_9BURK|nr:cell division protein FtsQ [Achromobacter aloeverae]RXN86646.1 cell division protein FtsQ [Achromobacter aloeverae]
MNTRPEQPPTANPSMLNRRTSRLAGVVLVAFMGAAVISNAWWTWTGDHTFLPDDLSTHRILDGGVTHDMSLRLADMDFSSEAARLQRGLGWLTLRDLGERVRRGCPGWLFLGDELQVHADAEANEKSRADIVVQLGQALAKRDIKLLVAVVPDKSRIEAARLCGLHRPAAFEGRLARWVQTLQGQGVQTLDLGAALSGLGQDAYYRTDTHWTEAGAGAAANVVADQVKRSGVPLQPPQRYRVTALPPAPRPGDLVRLAGVDWLPARLQPPGEIVEQHTWTVEAAAAAPAASADDLFGDSGLPTLALIGTSFSRTSAFVPQLSQALGIAVGNFARDGGKFGGAAQAYFKSAAWKQTPPRLVIWEMDERDLQAPLTAEDQVRF